MGDQKLTADQVRTWLRAVDADIEQLGKKLEPLLAEQERLEKQKELLQGLLGSFRQASPNGPAAAEAARGGGSVARYVIDRAIEILRDEGQPLHINDLHARFVERGLVIPGAGKSANLIVHLRTADEIASPQRGIYGLVEQVGTAARKARRRKRRKSGQSSRARGGNT